MEGGVEAGNLRQIGDHAGDRLDTGEPNRVVQRRQSAAAPDRGDHLGGNGCRLGQLGAAMHHPVADGAQAVGRDARRGHVV